MLKKNKKKLSLNRQTLRNLNDKALDSIAGGCGTTENTCDESMCIGTCCTCWGCSVIDA